MEKDKTMYYVNAIILVFVSTFFYAFQYFGWERKGMDQPQHLGSWLGELLSVTIIVSNLLLLIQLPMHVGFGLHCLTAYHRQNRWWEYIVFVAVLGWTLYVLYYVWFVTPWD